MILAGNYVHRLICKEHFFHKKFKQSVSVSSVTTALSFLKKHCETHILHNLSVNHNVLQQCNIRHTHIRHIHICSQNSHITKQCTNLTVKNAWCNIMKYSLAMTGNDVKWRQTIIAGSNELQAHSQSIICSNVRHV